MFSIIFKLTKTLLGQKNIKGKATTIWGGLPISFAFLYIFEKDGILPEGFTTFMSDINLNGYYIFLFWGGIFLYFFKDDFSHFIKRYFTADGRRDSKIEGLKDKLEKTILENKILEAEIEKIENKKRLKEVLRTKIKK